MSLGGEIKGTAYETRDVAQDYLLPFSQTLGNYGSTNLQDYSGWLNRLTSEDPPRSLPKWETSRRRLKP